MRKLREHAAEISRNLLGLETYLQLCGNQELKLENCRKVLEYNEIRIVVQTTELILEIWGAIWRQTAGRRSACGFTGKSSQFP